MSERCPNFNPAWSVCCKLDANHLGPHRWWFGDTDNGPYHYEWPLSKAEVLERQDEFADRFEAAGEAQHSDGG